jgi:hypothetical protein
LTTESDGAELVAGEADELLAGVEAAGTDALVGIDVQAVLKREHGFQTIAQRFGALEANTVAGADAGRNAAESIGAATRLVARGVKVAGIDDAVHGDVGLGEGSARSQAGNGQCDNFLLHDGSPYLLKHQN